LQLLPHAHPFQNANHLKVRCNQVNLHWDVLLHVGRHLRGRWADFGRQTHTFAGVCNQVKLHCGTHM